VTVTNVLFCHISCKLWLLLFLCPPAQCRSILVKFFYYCRDILRSGRDVVILLWTVVFYRHTWHALCVHCRYMILKQLMDLGMESAVINLPVNGTLLPLHLQLLQQPPWTVWWCSLFIPPQLSFVCQFQSSPGLATGHCCGHISYMTEILADRSQQSCSCEVQPVMLMSCLWTYETMRVYIDWTSSILRMCFSQ